MNYAYSGLDSCLVGSTWTVRDECWVESRKVELKLKNDAHVSSARIQCVRWMSLSQPQYHLAHCPRNVCVCVFFFQSYEYELWISEAKTIGERMNNRQANKKFCSRFVIFAQSKFSINWEVICNFCICIGMGNEYIVYVCVSVYSVKFSRNLNGLEWSVAKIQFNAYLFKSSFQSFAHTNRARAKHRQPDSQRMRKTEWKKWNEK